MKPLISLIIPCYNEEESLPHLYKELVSISSKMDDRFGVQFEYVFVDDGSRDNTLEQLKELAVQDDRVRYLSFSRNFGKEAAIYAGLQNCRGDYVSPIDADLQHPPSMLIDMYNGIVEEGYDRVAARRTSRDGEPYIRSMFARGFYKLINRISQTKMVDGATDYSMMTRQMVDAILRLEEYNRFTKGLNSWVGFRTKWLPYQNVERAAGTTKWSFWSLFLYSLDGILSFSTAPLAIASISGILLCLLAVIIICVVIIKTLLYGDPVAGFPTLICAVCVIGGIQLFCLGIMGQYISKMYLEVKRRPVYLVRES
ncbi:glycosyltransferase family 2 protein, partial [Ruminococcaceae bacterium OttesenSCG-928-L11]|nr:glycosyltransferase family 2 protein [Ruminococcaceae bacterium OttesenSCG-928-L11]